MEHLKWSGDNSLHVSTVEIESNRVEGNWATKTSFGSTIDPKRCPSIYTFFSSYFVFYRHELWVHLECPLGLCLSFYLFLVPWSWNGCFYFLVGSRKEISLNGNKMSIKTWIQPFFAVAHFIRFLLKCECMCLYLCSFEVVSILMIGWISQVGSYKF